MIAPGADSGRSDADLLAEARAEADSEGLVTVSVPPAPDLGPDAARKARERLQEVENELCWADSTLDPPLEHPGTA